MLRPSIKQLAKYSDIAYTENLNLLKAKVLAESKDWKFVMASQEAQGCYDFLYHSYALVNNASREVMVVNSGTRIHQKVSISHPGLLADAFSNLHILGKTTPIAFLDDGEKFLDVLIKKFPGCSFLNVGHSLGSVYAQLSHAYLLSKDIKSSSVGFESPGASEVLTDYVDKHIIDSKVNRLKILENVFKNSQVYNVEDSVISSQVHNQIGDLYIIADDDSIPIVSIIAKVLGAKGAASITKVADSFLSLDKHGLAYMIPRLDVPIKLAPCPERSDLVGDSLIELKALMDAA